MSQIWPIFEGPILTIFKNGYFWSFLGVLAKNVPSSGCFWRDLGEFSEFSEAKNYT